MPMETSDKPPRSDNEDERDDGDAAFVETLRQGPLHALRRFFPPIAYPAPTWLYTRFFFLRLLGLLYFVAFFSLYNQLLPLLGSRGLLPISRFLHAVEAHFGSRASAILKLPSLFWIESSDGVLVAAAAGGSILSLLLLAGVENAILQVALWALYLSFVQVGQIFYGYGWEMLILEAGFLSIFLCPVRSIRPLASNSPPDTIIVWLFRWLAFRVMFGAGLIKLRGDACWRDLTCLIYHYETQPNPNPLSYYLHAMPPWFHKAGVLFNHLVEVIVPFMIFGPRRVRHAAGALLVGFQVFLIISGNLSFLNWLTIAVCLFCFDDSLLRRLVPARIRELLAPEDAAAPPPRARRRSMYALAAVIGFLSLGPILNMLSPGQAMNASFEPLHLVNTYGAFGSVGQERYEVILEGTMSAELNESTVWREYEFPCKPGDVERRPCVITPYHYRLDWQMWFAAMSRVEEEPWLAHLVYKLLKGDPGARSLLARDPFGGARPRYVRAELYRYSFTRPGEGGAAWWRRTRAGTYLRPVTANDEELVAYLAAHGLIDRQARRD